MAEHFGFLLMPDSGLLPLSGAVDALLAANDVLERRHYAPIVLTAGNDRSTEVAHRWIATQSLASAPALQALFVVADGMPHDDDPALSTVLQALRAAAAGGALIGGLGTGAAWLARAGLLQGRRCTLHWAHVGELSASAPDVIVSHNVYELDGARLTCAGGSASLDMMIAWLGQRHGPELMRQLTERFAMERLRGRDERQHVPSAARLGASTKLVEAVALMEANIGEPLTTEDIARLVGVSRRQLERLFRQHLDALPSRWYLELRLARARRLLQQTPQSILQIGLSCGFSSASHFSNAYRNHFSRTPREERAERAAAWREGPRLDEARGSAIEPREGGE